jgi:hypothetical protein
VKDLPKDADAWHVFMKDLLGMPMWMLPAVQYAVRLGAWTRANNPAENIRICAERQALRTGLIAKPAPKVDLARNGDQE